MARDLPSAQGECDVIKRSIVSLREASDGRTFGLVRVLNRIVQPLEHLALG